MLKRFLCFLAAAVMLLCGLSVSAQSGFVRGDADGDGVVTVKDATLIQRVAKKKTKDPGKKIQKRGDVNGDGLKAADALWIQRFLAKRENPHAIGVFVSDQKSGETKESTVSQDRYELPFVED